MERAKLEANLAKLDYLQNQTGVKILHTLKSFNALEGLEIINSKLSGFSIGNPVELKMIGSLHPKHIHSYAPYFDPREITTIAQKSDTISFNSLHQWQNYTQKLQGITSLGLRINPILTLKQPKYCNANYAKHLGVNYREFLERFAQDPDSFQSLEGLHFHALCNQGIGGLKYLLAHIDKTYAHLLSSLKWLNLGGGHQLTHEDYDREVFIATVNTFIAKYPNLQLYFEPGESVVKNTGYFQTTIVDIIPSSPPIIMLDTSIEAHLLDIAITKQKPTIRNTVEHKTPHRYQIVGKSCIAGDRIGEYYFKEPLSIGDRVIFEDMMGYTMVKQTEFNGIERAGFGVVKCLDTFKIIEESF